MTNTIDSQERRTLLARFFNRLTLLVLVSGVIALAGCKSAGQADQQAGIAAAARVQAEQQTPRPGAVAQVDTQTTADPSAPAPSAPGAAASAPQATTSPGQTEADADNFSLREGDTVRITFPGAQNLNTVQVIRRDGKIALPLIGEVQAAGLPPTTLEKRLLELYGPQLQTKEVTVSLESSAFPIYVTGAVLRPGKVVSDRPISALEAIMEAGGFDFTRANMKKVRIIRYEKSQPRYFTVNLKAAMNGQDNKPFLLKPTDIIYVPERFTWF